MTTGEEHGVEQRVDEANLPPWIGKADNSPGLSSRPTRIPSAAVLTLNGTDRNRIRRFSRNWRSAVELSPAMIIVLGRLGVDQDALLTLDGIPTGVDISAVPLPVFVFPGGAPSAGRSRLALDFGNGARLLFLSWQDAVAESGETIRWLRQQIEDVDVASVALFFDLPPWDHAGPAGSQTFQRLLTVIDRPVTIVAGGGSRVSWWQEDRFTYIQLGDAAVGGPGTVTADGEASGVLVARFAEGRSRFRFLLPEDLHPLPTFSRSKQEERKALRRALTSTAADDRNPYTVVECTNTTGETLSFGTRWTAAEGRLSVEPEILGFRLQPGETFRQRFALKVENVPYLKFAAPVFSAETVVADGCNQPLRLVLRTRPLCRMSGEIPTIMPPPRVDGDLSEWDRATYPISHDSQIVRGAASRHGSEDSSALLRTAGTQRELFLALRIVDDDGFSEDRRLGKRVAEIRFGTATPSPRSAVSPGTREVAPGALRVIVSASGEAGFRAGSEWISGMRAGWRKQADGGVLELAVPWALLGYAAPPAFMRMDVILFDVDAGDEEQSVMYFSGDPNLHGAPDLGFGEFIVLIAQGG